MDKCPSKKIENPITKKCIKISGSLMNKLLKNKLLNISKNYDYNYDYDSPNKIPNRKQIMEVTKFIYDEFKNSFTIKQLVDLSINLCIKKYNIIKGWDIKILKKYMNDIIIYKFIEPDHIDISNLIVFYLNSYRIKKRIDPLEGIYNFILEIFPNNFKGYRSTEKRKILKNIIIEHLKNDRIDFRQTATR